VGLHTLSRLNDLRFETRREGHMPPLGFGDARASPCALGGTSDPQRNRHRNRTADDPSGIRTRFGLVLVEHAQRWVGPTTALGGAQPSLGRRKARTRGAQRRLLAPRSTNQYLGGRQPRWRLEPTDRRQQGRLGPPGNACELQADAIVLAFS